MSHLHLDTCDFQCALLNQWVVEGWGMGDSCTLNNHTVPHIRVCTERSLHYHTQQVSIRRVCRTKGSNIYDYQVCQMLRHAIALPLLMCDEPSIRRVVIAGQDGDVQYQSSTPHKCIVCDVLVNVRISSTWQRYCLLKHALCKQCCRGILLHMPPGKISSKSARMYRPALRCP